MDFKFKFKFKSGLENQIKKRKDFSRIILFFFKM